MITVATEVTSRQEVNRRLDMHERSNILRAEVDGWINGMKTFALLLAAGLASTTTAADFPGTVAQWKYWATFRPFTFTVKDAQSGLPASDVNVMVSCIGDTPFYRKSIRSDKAGKVTVFYPSNGFAPVVLTKDGYKTNNSLVYSKSPVIQIQPLETK